MTSDSLIAHMRRWTAVGKAVCYLNLMLLGIFGPIWSVALVCVTILFILLIFRGSKGLVAHPAYALLFCLFAILIVLPGGTYQEIYSASILSMRILAIMIASGMFGLVFEFNDIRQLSELLSLPGWAQFLAAALAVYIPMAIEQFQDVALAQRSRGLRFTPRHFLKPQIYSALTIPFVIVVARSAVTLWVSLNVRPDLEIRLPGANLSVIECLSVFVSFLLWVELETMFQIGLAFFSW